MKYYGVVSKTAIVSLVLLAVFIHSAWYSGAVANVAPMKDGYDWEKVSGAADNEFFFMDVAHVRIAEVNYEAPAAGQPCAVTAGMVAMVENPEDRDATRPGIDRAEIRYVVDENYAGVKSAPMTCAAGVCRGEIPGLPAGAKVTFIIYIEDTVGSVTTELFEALSSAGAAVALVYGYKRDSSFDPDKLDITAVGAAYDRNRLYVGYSIHGGIDGGSIDPKIINMFGVRISNPDTDSSGSIFQEGKLWFNLPLIKNEEARKEIEPELIKNFTGGRGTGKLAGEILDTGMFVISAKALQAGLGAEGIYSDARPRGVIAGDTFTGSVSTSLLERSRDVIARIVVFTISKSKAEEYPQVFDQSPFIQVYFRNHSYKVSD